MSKYLIFLLSLVLILSLIPITSPQAQSDADGDGLSDRIDSCPLDWGPRSNNGCPLPSNEPTHDPNDTDGDGNPNTADRCPNEGGPASNGGCPEGQANPCPEGFSGQNCSQPAPAETEVFTLPILPTTGNCVLATAGQTRVNVRNIPDLAGEVVGQLEPTAVYPLHFHIIGATLEDSWFLVDLGWVSAAVVRLGGSCSNVPSLKIPLNGILQLGDLGIIFLGEHEAAELAYPNLDEDSSNPNIPPFLLQACDGSVRVTWLQQDFKFCDGSVMPTDQIPNDEDGSTFECDGDFNLLLPAVKMGDGSVMPVPEFLFGLLLPAVKMGDGSVLPAEEFLGDGSVMPCPSANIMIGTHGTGGGGGAGKVIFQDIHFIALKNAAGNFGIIILDIPQGEGGVRDPFLAFTFRFGVPPEPEMDWTQIGNLIIGHWQGNTYVCPSDPSAESNNNPSTGAEAVGFDPQPDPPAECIGINYANEQ